MSYGSAAVVSPEAVLLEFEAAGVGSRSVAFALDLAIMAGTLVLLGFVAGIASATSPGALPTVVVVVITMVATFLVFWGYPVAFESLARGRTVGKMAMGLRVVQTDGAPIRFRHAAVRAILGLIDFYLPFLPGAPAVLTSLLTRRHQRLGDLAAGTMVIRERTGAGAVRSVAFAVPSGWEPYAATLDVSALDPTGYAAVRELLLRAPHLAPVARTELSRQLAGAVAARIRAAPDPAVPAEVFLLCVAARYQARTAPGSFAPSVAAAAPAVPARAPAPHAVPPVEGGSGGTAGGFTPPA